MTAPITANDNLTAKNTGDQLQPGLPTTWGMAISQVANTAVDFANNDLAHVCDFSSELIKDNQLKRFINAQANNIREAIREVMRLLGLSDGTGQFQWIKDSLQSIQRGLKYINEEVIQPILDFEAIVIGYIAKIKKIIDYILSLPAKLLALLQDCLSKLYELVANAFTDITGGGGKSSEFDDIIKTAKSTAQTLKTTVSAAAQAATTAAGIATIVSSAPNLVSGLKKGP
jgi:phage-related protein